MDNLILKHKILRALSYNALKINKVGSIKDGYVIIDRYNIDNAIIQYSTLCCFLNNEEKYLGDNIGPSLSNYEAKTRGITCHYEYNYLL